MIRKLKLRPKELYIALENFDFSWEFDEVEQVRQMWNEGADIREIGEDVKRPTDEVALLVMDLAIKQRVKMRESGVFGRR